MPPKPSDSYILPSDRFKSTLSGGISIGTLTLARTAVAISPHIDSANIVYVRLTRLPMTTVIFRSRTDVTAENAYGEVRDLPGWALQLRDILHHSQEQQA